MFIVAWIDGNNRKTWEVISGEDSMQEFVDVLINAGVSDEEIVVGDMSEFIE